MRLRHWYRGRIVSEDREEMLVTVGTPSATCRRLVEQRSSWTLSARRCSFWPVFFSLRRSSQRWSVSGLIWSRRILVWHGRIRSSIYSITLPDAGCHCLVSRRQRLGGGVHRSVHSTRSLLVCCLVVNGA